MVTYENRFVNIIKGVSVIIIFFLISLFKTIPLTILNIDYNSLNLLTKEIYTITIELITILIIFFIFKDQYIKAFKDIKKNHLNYFSENIKYYFLGLAIMMASNALILMLGGGAADNETAVRNQFAIAPIYTFIAGVFLAPILEESVFRLGIRNIFKNKFLFILASGLIFGSMHLTGMLDNHLIGLHLLAYSSLGFIFAYILTKTNNIFTTMGFHFMHNGILMSLQIFTALFG